MAGRYRAPGFSSGEILLPAPHVDMAKWAVIACDQFTSQPEYWAEAECIVGDAPSALRLTLPEIYLNESEVRVRAIRASMRQYLDAGHLATGVADGFVLVERATGVGNRLGLVGLIDLDEYDSAAGAKTLVRPTEGTIPERVPPRARIRAGAPMELPHVMMLIDDPAQTVIEALFAERDVLSKRYDFELMLDGGHLAGWAVEGDHAGRAADALSALHAKSRGLLYAVGDGNHSLAAAKHCWMEIKRALPAGEAANHPARWALVELVNIHCPALVFEPIHRIIKGVDAQALARAYEAYLQSRGIQPRAGADVRMIAAGIERGYGFDRHPLADLQQFLDSYVATHPNAEIDYIHGEADLRALAGASGAGFLLRSIDKSELFPFIADQGVLPRKAFSMGEARDKRYYLEARMLAD